MARPKGITAWNKGLPAPWAKGLPHAFQKGSKPWNIGLKASPLTIEKLRETHVGKIGEEAVRWRGEGAKYSAKHMWVRKMLGRPAICENCKNKSLRPRQYHWANISGQYLRDLRDWVRLCVKCHKAYDQHKIALS